MMVLQMGIFKYVLFSINFILVSVIFLVEIVFFVVSYYGAFFLLTHTYY